MRLPIRFNYDIIFISFEKNFKYLETKSTDDHLCIAGPGPSGAAVSKVILLLLRDVGPHRIVPMLGSKGLTPSQIPRLKLGTF